MLMEVKLLKYLQQEDSTRHAVQFRTRRSDTSVEVLKGR